MEPGYIPRHRNEWKTWDVFYDGEYIGQVQAKNHSDACCAACEIYEPEDIPLPNHEKVNAWDDEKLFVKPA